MDALAVVPVVSALLGPVVGLAAAKTAISHFRYGVPSFYKLLVLVSDHIVE